MSFIFEAKEEKNSNDKCVVNCVGGYWIIMLSDGRNKKNLAIIEIESGIKTRNNCHFDEIKSIKRNENKKKKQQI